MSSWWLWGVADEGSYQGAEARDRPLYHLVDGETKVGQLEHLAVAEQDVLCADRGWEGGKELAAGPGKVDHPGVGPPSAHTGGRSGGRLTRLDVPVDDPLHVQIADALHERVKDAADDECLGEDAACSGRRGKAWVRPCLGFMPCPAMLSRLRLSSVKRSPRSQNSSTRKVYWSFSKAAYWRSCGVHLVRDPGHDAARAAPRDP